MTNDIIMTSSKPKAKGQGSDKGVEWEDKVIRCDKAAVLSCENITFETFRSSPEALCRKECVQLCQHPFQALLDKEKPQCPRRFPRRFCKAKAFNQLFQNRMPLQKPALKVDSGRRDQTKTEIALFFLLSACFMLLVRPDR